MHVDERGTGVPVVLLHGAPTAPEHMHPLAARLARSYRVLVVHLPGYGRTAAIDPYAMEHSHALVEAELGSRGVRAAHLIGFACGAYRALALAVRGVIDVLSVVSLAGSASFRDDENNALVRSGALLRGVDRARHLVDVMLSPRGRENAASVADVRSWAAAIAPTHLERELQAFASAVDLRSLVANLDVPVLARAGSIDAAFSPESSRRIVEAARHGCLEEVPGVGHALLCEDFASTAASVERHLRAVARG